MIGVALFICGVIFLVKGRIPYGKKKDVRGPLLFGIAALLMLPCPIFFVYYFIEGFNAGAQGKQLDMEKLTRETLMIELPVYLGAALLSWGLVAVNANPTPRKRRRNEDDYDDDYDRRRDFDEERPRRRYTEEDDEHRPRRRYADEDDERRPRRRYADEDEDRPRRKYADDDDDTNDRWRRDDDDRERRRN